MITILLTTNKEKAGSISAAHTTDHTFDGSNFAICKVERYVKDWMWLWMTSGAKVSSRLPLNYMLKVKTCLLSASLIKSNSPVPSTGPQSWERTEKGQEVGWNEIRKRKTVPLTLPRRSIDLTNWNGIEGETPDGSPLAWGGVLAGSDRIPSETHCPWGPCWCLSSFPSLFLTVICSQHILLVALIECL